VLAAAMLGLGEVVEPEKTKVVIEQESDDPYPAVCTGRTTGARRGAALGVSRPAGRRG
jgi:hypothetical protein